MHVGGHALKIAQHPDTDVVATTFRCPFHTAASWANRGKLEKEKWCEQWMYYKTLLDLNPVVFYCDGLLEQHGLKFPPPLNSSPDTFGLHKALYERDWEYYHRYVDKSLTDYSLQCVSASPAISYTPPS